MKNVIATLLFFSIAGCQVSTLPGGSIGASTSRAAAPGQPPVRASAPQAPTGGAPTPTGRPPDPAGDTSSEARDCGPANDHCLHHPTFAIRDDADAMPVYEVDGRWWSTWQDDEVTERPIVVTRAIERDEIRVGMRLVYRSAIPLTDGDALSGWSIDTVASIEKNGQVTFESRRLPKIAAARIVVEEMR